MRFVAHELTSPDCNILNKSYGITIHHVNSVKLGMNNYSSSLSLNVLNDYTVLNLICVYCSPSLIREMLIDSLETFYILSR